MGYITSADCTLTNDRTPESPRSNSCVTRPYSTFDIPAQPYPFRLAPKKPRSAMGLTSSLGKRPARLHSSMMGMRLSSMNFRVVSRTRRSSSVSRESNSRKSTPRNLMAISFSFLFHRREPAHALRGWKLLKVTKGGRAVKQARIASENPEYKQLTGRIGSIPSHFLHFKLSPKVGKVQTNPLHFLSADVPLANIVVEALHLLPVAPGVAQSSVHRLADFLSFNQ